MSIKYLKENDVIFREEIKTETKKIEINPVAKAEMLDIEISNLKEKLIVLEKEKSDLTAMLC